MQTRHTPGPWAIRENDRAIVPAADPRRLVAHGGSILPENARLIAAAPDLLAHLTRLIAAIDRLPGNNPLDGLADEARAAIARATGQ